MRTTNEQALLQWRRAATQEARAFKLYDQGRITAAELTRELRRAEQTRLKCTAYLPLDHEADTPTVQREAV